MTPVVGARGVSALYARTAHLTGQATPGSNVSHLGSPAEVDMTVPGSMITLQTAADAAAAAVALLQTFHQLLCSLIGWALTERLLRPVWATFMCGPSPAPTSP